MSKVGTRFTTGNATVRTLKVGTVLEVVGPSTVEIVDVPAPQVGETVVDFKGRTGRVVRLSERSDFDPSQPIAVFGDNVVRNIN